MKCIGTLRPLSADHPDALVEFDAPVPQPAGQDLLVAIRAVAVNPVDAKVRLSYTASTSTPRVLGWDAAGIVEAVGPEVSRFRAGDRVWYAGAIARPGSNAERQLVDERIVGHAPAKLGDSQAAALPLTTITAWELLFDRLRVAEGGGDGDALLIVGAGGGVGSMLVQLARKLTRLTVIGTASRPESRDWVSDLGAHHVIDHGRPLAAQLQQIGIPRVRYVASLTHTDLYYPQLVDIIAPQGALALIDDPKTLDAVPLKTKSVSLHWEFMFTRSMHQTTDQVAQHEILERVARLVDDGQLRSTVSEHLGAINATNLRRAHRLIEGGRTRGKIVLEGF